MPVYKEIVADLLTPVSAFLKIAEHSDYAFLLESVEGGEQVGRYSFLGKDPFLILRSRGGKTIVDRAGQTSESDKPFIATLRELMAGFHSPFVPGLPRFTGGAVGYLGYDAAAWFEPVTLQDGAEPEDEAGFMLFDTVLAFDHVRHRILIIANARITGDEDLESLYQFACAKIEFVERELERPLSKTARAGCGAGRGDVQRLARRVRVDGPRRRRSTSPPATSTRWCCRSASRRALAADPFTVYRALRHVNPSPYMYFLRIGDRSIVGSSPEMLVRVEGRSVQTHPIAGTRPRGRNEEEDMRLAEELKRNEKERAEHVMLVDLGRNDVGRVSAYGSVKVPTLHGARALLARHAPGVDRRGQAVGRPRSARCARRLLPGGHRLRRAQGARDGDHRRAREPAARRLRRRRGLPRLRGQPRFLHHDSHGA